MDMLKTNKNVGIIGGGVDSSTLAKSISDILALKHDKIVAYVPKLDSMDIASEETVKCVEYNPNMMGCGVQNADDKHVIAREIFKNVGCHLIGCEELINVIDEAQELEAISEKLNFSNETLQSIRRNVEFEITRIPRITDTMFYPKVKHLPKGHQRPYKFHK